MITIMTIRIAMIITGITVPIMTGMLSGACCVVGLSMGSEGVESALTNSCTCTATKNMKLQIPLNSIHGIKWYACLSLN